MDTLNNLIEQQNKASLETIAITQHEQDLLRAITNYLYAYHIYFNEINTNDFNAFEQNIKDKISFNTDELSEFNLYSLIVSEPDNETSDETGTIPKGGMNMGQGEPTDSNKTLNQDVIPFLTFFNVRNPKFKKSLQNNIIQYVEQIKHINEGHKKVHNSISKNIESKGIIKNLIMIKNNIQSNIIYNELHDFHNPRQNKNHYFHKIEQILSIIKNYITTTDNCFKITQISSSDDTDTISINDIDNLMNSKTVNNLLTSLKSNNTTSENAFYINKGNIELLLKYLKSLFKETSDQSGGSETKKTSNSTTDNDNDNDTGSDTGSDTDTDTGSDTENKKSISDEDSDSDDDDVKYTSMSMDAIESKLKDVNNDNIVLKSIRNNINNDDIYLDFISSFSDNVKDIIVSNNNKDDSILVKIKKSIRYFRFAIDNIIHAFYTLNVDNTIKNNIIHNNMYHKTFQQQRLGNYLYNIPNNIQMNPYSLLLQNSNKLQSGGTEKETKQNDTDYEKKYKQLQQLQLLYQNILVHVPLYIYGQPDSTTNIIDNTSINIFNDIIDNLE